MGGELVLVYDDRYPEEAAGFVLVDSSHPEQAGRFPAEVQELLYDPEPPLWVFRIFAPYGIFAGLSQNPEDAYWWRSFPEGMMAESDAAETISQQAARTSSLGSRPVVVLTAGVVREFAGVSEKGNAAYRRVWFELQEQLARLSTNSDHRIINGATHDIQGDRPEAVVAAIKDVVMAVREGGRVARP